MQDKGDFVRAAPGRRGGEGHNKHTWHLVMLVMQHHPSQPESLSGVSSDWTDLAIGLNEKGSFRPLVTGDKPECESHLNWVVNEGAQPLPF